MERRQFLISALVGGSCLCPAHRALAADSAVMQRSSGPLADINASTGCMVTEKDFARDKLAQLGSGEHPTSTFVAGNQRYQVGASSGNRAFDRALAEALYHLSKTFDVLPTFGFIKGENVANAFATTALFKPENGDDNLPTREDGTVLFGNGIVDLMQRKGVSNIVGSVLAVCAHEFGHIVQYRYNYNDKPLISILNDDQPTVKRAELHADFLAGYYIGVAKKRNPDTPAASVAHAARVLGDMDVNNRSHHGTPEERGAAVYAGFQHSFEHNKPFAEASVDGLRYVKAI